MAGGYRKQVLIYESLATMRGQRYGPPLKHVEMTVSLAKTNRARLCNCPTHLSFWTTLSHRKEVPPLISRVSHVHVWAMGQI